MKKGFYYLSLCRAVDSFNFRVWVFLFLKSLKIYEKNRKYDTFCTNNIEMKKGFYYLSLCQVVGSF